MRCFSFLFSGVVGGDDSGLCVFEPVVTASSYAKVSDRANPAILRPTYSTSPAARTHMLRTATCRGWLVGVLRRSPDAGRVEATPRSHGSSTRALRFMSASVDTLACQRRDILAIEAACNVLFPPVWRANNAAPPVANTEFARVCALCYIHRTEDGAHDIHARCQWKHAQHKPPAGL